MPSVDVVLATFKGIRHLPAQIDSLQRQSYADFCLLIRDDGSPDGTFSWLENATKRDGRFRLLPMDEERLGACGNFSRLLEHTTAPYVAFCDQDDVWHPDKILRSLGCMADLERTHGASAPILVHGDLHVVGPDLSPRAESFAAYQGLQLGDADELRRQLVQNSVTGCAMMVNRALLDLALPIPRTAIMHDHWLGLIACAFGHVGLMDGALVEYRQHGGNAVGAVKYGPAGAWRSFRSAAPRERLARSWAQARSLLEIHGHRLTWSQQRLVSAWAGMPQIGPLKRRYLIIRHRLWKRGFLRNLALLLFA